nr:unnamed protein product [Callosobruchus analis]
MSSLCVSLIFLAHWYIHLLTQSLLVLIIRAGTRFFLTEMYSLPLSKFSLRILHFHCSGFLCRIRDSFFLDRSTFSSFSCTTTSLISASACTVSSTAVLSSWCNGESPSDCSTSMLVSSFGFESCWNTSPLLFRSTLISRSVRSSKACRSSCVFPICSDRDVLEETESLVSTDTGGGGGMLIIFHRILIL